MPDLFARIRNEPVLVTAIVTAAVGLVVAFGVDVSDELAAAIVTFVGAVLALVARRQTYGPETVKRADIEARLPH